MTTLVLIDNNKDDLLFMKEALASIDSSIQCLSFVYSEEAMNAMKHKILDGPDAVFMNINMPRRNGIQCLMELRSNPTFENLPVILYGPRITIDILEALKGSGVTTAFEKPNTMLGWKKNMKQPFTVLYEDNHLLVVNKFPGVLSQGDATGDKSLVELCKAYIAEKFKKPGAVFLGLVHRLDRPVSGVVVLARTSKALERMNALFRNKQTKKVYWAIVRNKPRSAQETLTHWLRKDEAKNRTTAFKIDTEGAQYAELDYRVISTDAGYWLLEVSPLTGRP